MIEMIMYLISWYAQIGGYPTSTQAAMLLSGYELDFDFLLLWDEKQKRGRVAYVIRFGKEQVLGKMEIVSI